MDASKVTAGTISTTKDPARKTGTTLQNCVMLRAVECKVRFWKMTGKIFEKSLRATK